MQKFSKAGALMMDLCVVTCSTARACTLLDQHRKFFGCDVDLDVLIATKPDLALTFAFQVLNPKSGISEAVKTKQQRQLLRTKWLHFWLGRSLCVESSMYTGCNEVLARHVPKLLSALYGSYSLFEMCRDIYVGTWLPVWTKQLCSTDLNFLLAHDCGRCRVSVER